MTQETRTRSRLVEHLRAVANRDDRATLAALRSSLRPGHELDALRVVLPFLGASSGRENEDAAILLAGLFALHPESGDLSLAKALRIVRDQGSDSVEGRFRALLSATRVELATHLRHAVSLVASKHQAIDWDDLYRAIRHWDHEEDFARRRWATAFWADEADVDTSAVTAPTS